MRVRLAITMGDAAGIGPEIILKAVRDLAARESATSPELMAFGSRSQFRAAQRLLPEDGPALHAWIEQHVIEVAADEDGFPVEPGMLDAKCGRVAFRAIERSISSAQAGDIDAIVTAPISKEALHLAGFNYAGHTEIVRDLTASADTCMLLAHGSFRVSHVTTHVALSEVPRLVTPERVRRVVELTHEALLAFGVAGPRIAVCALNPHAGEGGMFGREDQDVLAPVVQEFRARGLDVSGPHPGDTVFVRARAGLFDAVVAMFHDQGHIPVKLLGFSIDPVTGAWTDVSGVNITLGSPVIRTSVDHGTAFDIAGKGIANHASMVQAIELAAQLASNRKQTNDQRRRSIQRGHT